MGVTVPLALGIGGAFAASKVLKPKTPQPVAPPPLPKAPEPEAAQSQASDVIKRKRAAQTKSVFTSPLGISGQADIVKKTLLGN